MRLSALVLVLWLSACGVIENASDGTQMVVEADQLVLSGTITSRTPQNFERILGVEPADQDAGPDEGRWVD